MTGLKICLYGAGAVGSLLGARLAALGCEISAIARGTTLAALKSQGLRMQLKDELSAHAVRAEAEPSALGVQDVVIVAVKAPALRSVADKIAPLLDRNTTVVTAMNGVPWWFFDGIGGAHDGMQLESVDPAGAIAQAIPTRHVVGCVVHLTCSVPEPGLVKHGFGNRLILGEPFGGESSRTQDLSALFGRAGFEVSVSPRIQNDIWYKLWGNMTMNPVSALTGATCDRILDDPLVNAFCLSVMGEAGRIGARIGCPIAQSGEDRNAVTRQLGAFKTSMLQDVEAGREVELDALVSVVREIGQKVGEPTPSIDALLGLARLHAQVRGLYA